jgi:type IV secretion system protein VirB10
LQSKVQNTLALAVVLLLGGGFLAWYYSGLADSRAAQKPKPAAVSSEVKLPPLGPAPPKAKPVESSSLVEVGTPEAEQLLTPATTGAAAIGGSSAVYPYGAAAYGAAPAYAAPPPPDPVLQRKLESPVLVRSLVSVGDADQIEDVRAAGDVDGSRSSRARSGLPVGGGVAGGAGGTELGGMLRPTVIPASVAGVLPDRRWLLPKGAFIDCTLETAIDSTLPGMTTCVTATDVWSADGSVVLLERGTKLVGETRSGVAQGQRRLFVLWNEARTPAGVSVELGSPGTDALGRSGVTGDVDTHFAARFGAAILISLIDAAAAAVVAAQSDGDGSVVIAPQGASDVMSEVLRSTVNVPPTIRVAQGERVSVLVARDVSFGEVYALEQR